jgi:DNA invertase Pin-like site-specific DNA recombinase
VIAVVYVRASITHAHSRAQQLRRVREWARRRGDVTIVAVLSDDGKSGALTEDEGREGLAHALATVEDGLAEMLVVPALDRLARKLIVQEAVLAKVWAVGASVWEADRDEEVPEDDPDDPMRTAMRQMAAVFGELERSMTRLRLRRGRVHKHQRGGYAGGRTVPFGQRVEGEGREARRVPCPNEAAVCERVRKLRGSGATYASIAERLNAEGVPTKLGRRWHVSQVRRVLARA